MTCLSVEVVCSRLRLSLICVSWMKIWFTLRLRELRKVALVTRLSVLGWARFVCSVSVLNLVVIRCRVLVRLFSCRIHRLENVGNRDSVVVRFSVGTRCSRFTRVRRLL